MRGKRIAKSFAGTNDVFVSLAFSPNGRFLAASDMGRAVYLENLETGAAQNLQAEGVQFQLAFSPDSQRLASVDREKTKLWDVTSGREVLLLYGAPARSWDGGYNPQIAWSPDGRRLGATNWTQVISIWDAAEHDTPEAKVLMRQAAEERAFHWHVAGYYDGTRNQMPLVERFHRAALMELQPATAQEWFERAQVNSLAGSAEDAEKDFANAEERHPDLAALRLQWATQLLRTGHMKEALGAYRRAFELRPSDDVYDWANYAGAELLAGDSHVFRILCTQMAERFKEWNLGEAKYMLARTCSLHSATLLPPGEAVALAESGVSWTKNAATLHTLAMAHLRAGELTEAEQRLLESLKADPNWLGGALNRYALALVYLRQGNAESARQNLELANQEYERLMKGHRDPTWLPQEYHPFDGIELQLLHQEALKLGKAPAPGSGE